jgi:hypothetical protein
MLSMVQQEGASYLPKKSCSSNDDKMKNINDV